MVDELAKKLEFLENNYRHKALFLILFREDNYLTTDILAKKLDVTSRTIKSDIKYLEKQINIDGISVIAQRSKGVRIKVEDIEIEKRIKEYFKIYNEHNIDKDFDRNVQYIIKKLLTTNQNVKIENLQNELFLNTSNYIQREIMEVRSILKRYNLTLTTKIKKGLMVEGDSYYKNLCMLNMYKFFMPISDSKIKNQEYSRLFIPKFGTKEEIKEIVCASLGKTRIVFSDIYLERFILYIILLSNVVLPTEDDKLKNIDFDYTTTEEYRFVLDVERHLAEKYKNFASNNEIMIMSLTYLAIMSTDLYRIKDCTKENYGSLIALADEMRTDIVKHFEETFNVSIINNTTVIKDLLKFLIPIAMKVKLGISDDTDLGFYSYESMTTKPVIKEFVYSLSGFINNKYSYVFSMREMHLLLTIIYEFINDIELSRKKQKIAIIALDGRLSTQQLKFCMRKYFSSYIESISTKVLHELNESDASNFDLFFCMDFGKYLDIPYEPIYFFKEGMPEDEYRNQLQDIFLSSYYYNLFFSKIEYYKIPSLYKFQDFPIKDFLNSDNDYMEISIGNKNNIDIYLAFKSKEESFKIHYYAEDESPIDGKQCYIIINLDIDYNEQKFKMLLNIIDGIAEDPERLKYMYGNHKLSVDTILKK